MPITYPVKANSQTYDVPKPALLPFASRAKPKQSLVQSDQILPVVAGDALGRVGLF